MIVLFSNTTSLPATYITALSSNNLSATNSILDTFTLSAVIFKAVLLNTATSPVRLIALLIVSVPKSLNSPSNTNSSKGTSDFKTPFSSKKLLKFSGVTILLIPTTLKVAVDSLFANSSVKSMYFAVIV